MSYRVVVVDLFHAHDEDEVWPSANFTALGDAVAFAQRKIDSEIAHAIEEERQAGPVTREAVLKRFFSFGELPLVMTTDYNMAFDSRAYATERAHALIRK